MRILHICFYILEYIASLFLSYLFRYPRYYKAYQRPSSIQSNLMSQNDCDMAEQQSTTLAPKSSSSLVDTEQSHAHTSSTTFPLLKLPKEIQYQIYEWVVGNRTLHVLQNMMDWPEPIGGGLYCYTCHTGSSQFDVYNSYTKMIFEDRTGSALEELNLDQGCRCCFIEREQYNIDLSLLSVSKEAAREAQKMFYSSNTWYFHNPGVLFDWLTVIPSEKLALVQSLHLVIHVYRYMSAPGPYGIGWKNVLSDHVSARLPNLKTLHFELYADGFLVEPIVPSPQIATFTRQTKEAEVVEFFRPLQRLEKLKYCTVVMYQLRFGGEEVLNMGPLWPRKEALRVWAEDIRSLIIGESLEVVSE